MDVAKFDRPTLLEYYAKVLLTDTAYIPAKEEQEEGEEAGDSDGERLSLLRVMPVCNALPVVICLLKKSVLR